MKSLFTSILMLLLLSLTSTSFSATTPVYANKNFTLSNIFASVGVNARETQLIVYGNWAENGNQAIYLSLGTADDPIAKARYATIIAAMGLGKRVYISYWTANTATNYEAYIDDVAEMWTVKIIT